MAKSSPHTPVLSALLLSLPIRQILFSNIEMSPCRQAEMEPTQHRCTSRKNHGVRLVNNLPDPNRTLGGTVTEHLTWEVQAVHRTLRTVLYQVRLDQAND